MLKQCKVIKKLGDGGEGVVAMVDIAGEIFALKIMFNFHQSILKNQFENEWRILTRLNSQFVIKQQGTFVNTPTDEMMDCFDPTLLEFLQRINPATQIMEPVQMRFYLLEFHVADLETHFKLLRDSNQINWQKIFKYSLQLLQGLSYLFGMEVVHNDLKMSNILLSLEDSLVLNDFGFAFIAHKHLANRKNLKLGNRFSKAPEIHNKLARKDAIIDVTKQYSWEAGCLLFEIAFGIVPFRNYPFGFGDTGFFEVPPVQVPDHLRVACTSSNEEEMVNDFTGLLCLLLKNNEEERIHIRDALLIMEELCPPVNHCD